MFAFIPDRICLSWTQGMRNVHSGTSELSPGLCTMLAFLAWHIRMHLPASHFVAHSHLVIYSCVQEHLPILMFPNHSRNSWRSTWRCVTYFYPAVLHTGFIDVGDISFVRASAGKEDGGVELYHEIDLFSALWLPWNPEDDVDKETYIPWMMIFCKLNLKDLTMNFAVSYIWWQQSMKGGARELC